MSPLFENDVKMYGTQTLWNARSIRYMFENDVKMYGTQTYLLHREHVYSLRMM